MGGLALAFASTLLALVGAEVGLRLFSDDRHYVWPPNLERRLTPRSDILPGVNGPSRFATNGRGIRGRPLSETDEYRILAIGGSTTECYYLDQEEAWPHLLEAELSSVSGNRFWVGNVGRSGHGSRHHALQVEHLLDEYPKIDMAVLLVGLNDFLLRLRRDQTFKPLEAEPPEYSRELFRLAFAQGPGRNSWEPAYKRAEIWQSLRNAKQAFLEPPAGPFQDDGGVYVAEERGRRQAASTPIDRLPDLTEALADFERTIRGIVASLKDRGVVPVLVTQPTMWRPDLAPRLANLLWFGQRGETDEFYSVSALASGISPYNDRLMRVCEDTIATCVDLAAALPKDTTIFYDDAHFNEAGARRVASELAEALGRAPGIDLPAETRRSRNGYVQRESERP